MPDLIPEQMQEIRELVRARKMIEAVKAYRVATGVGLAEAKHAIDVMFHKDPLGSPQPAQPAPVRAPISEDQIKELLLKRNKIEAVKLYREMSGLGLKESKDVVDQIEAAMRRERSSMEAPYSDDPFAEDDRRRRRVMFVFALLIVALGIAIIFFVKGM